MMIIIGRFGEENATVNENGKAHGKPLCHWSILVNTVFRSARVVFNVVPLSLPNLSKDNKEKDNRDIILESRLFKSTTFQIRRRANKNSLK